MREAVAALPPFGFALELDRDARTAINWAGESAGLVGEVLGPGRIVRRVADDAERRRRAAGRLLAE